MNTNRQVQGRWRRRGAVGVAGVTVLLAACSATGTADLAGGDTVVLRLATIDGDVNSSGQSVGPETFVEQLGELSGGRLQVQVSTTYGDRAVDAESRLVQAIASGDVDGGWPSTRAFASAGIHGLEAIEAPMTLASTAAVAAVVTGPAGATVPGLLDGSGVEALELAAGPLRRPFAAEQPLLGPDDWAGQPFRVFDSPVQTDTVTALGATPVDVGLTWVEEVEAGNLRGAEFDIAQYAFSGFETEAGAVTSNVVLWPKVFVLALSDKRFGSLTEQQQGWVREAARLAAQASVDAAVPDDARAEDLCGRGVRFVPASEVDVAALRSAVAPVVDGLAADPVTAPLLEEVMAVAREHPDVEPVEVPAECTVLSSAEEPAVPTEAAAVPDGVYRVELTAEEVAAAGVGNGPGWSGTWTLEIEDATYVVTCRPLDQPGRDCGNTTGDGPREAGTLRGAGTSVTFVYDVERMAALTGCTLPPSESEGACYEIDPYSVQWAMEGDELTFTDTDDAAPYYSLTLEPYRRIG